VLDRLAPNIVAVTVEEVNEVEVKYDSAFDVVLAYIII